MLKEDNTLTNEQREEMATVPQTVDYKLFMELFIKQLSEKSHLEMKEVVELMLYRTYIKMMKNTPLSELLQLISSISQPKEEKPMTSKYYLAEHCKTSFTKIIWALNDMKMIQTENGMLPSSKQDVIEEFGRFLNTDLSKYSTLLSSSKAQDKEEGFLEVIKKMEESLRKYFYRNS